MAETKRFKIVLDKDELGHAVEIAQRQNMDYELPPEAQLVEPWSLDISTCQNGPKGRSVGLGCGGFLSRVVDGA
jgi:hypothetical protein